MSSRDYPMSNNINNTLALLCSILARFKSFRDVNYILLDSNNGCIIIKIVNGKFYWNNGKQHEIKDVKLIEETIYKFDELCEILVDTVEKCNYSRIEIRNNRKVIVKIVRASVSKNLPIYKEYTYYYYPLYTLMFDEKEFNYMDIPMYATDVLNLVSSVGIISDRIIIDSGTNTYIVFKRDDRYYMLVNGKISPISTHVESAADVYNLEKLMDDAAGMHEKLLNIKIESKVKSMEIRRGNQMIAKVTSELERVDNCICLTLRGNTVIVPQLTF